MLLREFFFEQTQKHAVLSCPPYNEIPTARLPAKLKFSDPKGNLRKENREQGFDKVKSLWKGRDGVWGREGKTFL